ncbi:MAG: hypothetical protein AAGC68_03890 [Verrucomicrobiota bacterium]
MKQSILILVGLALATPSLPLQSEENTKPDGKPERKRGSGQETSARGDGSFFKMMDKNGDQSISKEEAGQRWEHLAKLDKDGNGSISAQEMAAGRGSMAQGSGARGQKGQKGGGGEMFKRADKNGDGKISKDEVPAQAWERLGKLDKNGDNAVSQAEAQEMGRPGSAGTPGKPGSSGQAGRGGEMLKRADKNGDGNLSKDEVPAQAWERLGRLDKNGDDVVSKEELAAGMSAMQGGAGGKKGSKGKGGSQGGPGAVFGRFDTNKDGKLSESEVPAEMWGRLRNSDENADGVVSRKELDKVYKEREEGGYGGGSKPEKKESKPEEKTAA